MSLRKCRKCVIQGASAVYMTSPLLKLLLNKLIFVIGNLSNFGHIWPIAWLMMSKFFVLFEKCVTNVRPDAQKLISRRLALESIVEAFGTKRTKLSDYSESLFLFEIKYVREELLQSVYLNFHIKISDNKPEIKKKLQTGVLAAIFAGD